MPVTVTELDHSTVFVFWSTLMPYLIINMACCEVFKKKQKKNPPTSLCLNFGE